MFAQIFHQLLSTSNDIILMQPEVNHQASFLLIDYW